MQARVAATLDIIVVNAHHGSMAIQAEATASLDSVIKASHCTFVASQSKHKPE